MASPCEPGPLETLAERHFGFAQFKPGQQEVMGHLLAGRSAAAVFPTGGGKSLCYQLPAIVLPGLTLVVSPLIALMKDQIDALAARGV
jgi:ATP-dependent DNA helicase RecQ